MERLFLLEESGTDPGLLGVPFPVCRFRFALDYPVLFRHSSVQNLVRAATMALGQSERRGQLKVNLVNLLVPAEGR